MKKLKREARSTKSRKLLFNRELSIYTWYSLIDLLFCFGEYVLHTQRQTQYFELLCVILNSAVFWYIEGDRLRPKHTLQGPVHLPCTFTRHLKNVKTGNGGVILRQTWVPCLVINFNMTLSLWLFVYRSWHIARFLAQHGSHVLNMTFDRYPCNSAGLQRRTQQTIRREMSFQGSKHHVWYKDTWWGP